MTNKDAIYILENEYTSDVYISKANLDLAIEKAVKALEKRIPQKPNYEEDYYDEDCDTWLCPKCGRRFVDYEIYNYCPYCGQAIDRSDEDE